MDRAALDLALEQGVACGGWCPAGRRAEDGRIHARYPLLETPTPVYAQRTRWNVRDSDATLLVAPRPLMGGTRYAADWAAHLARPRFQIDPFAATSEDLRALLDWCRTNGTVVLHIAGPRASSVPRIYLQSRAILEPLIEALTRRSRPARR